MFTRFALLVLCLMVLSILGCQSSDEIKIGVMAPRTGVLANLGEQMLRGIELAKNETAYSFPLIVEDDQCDSKVGMTVAQKLVEVDQVSAILGSVCTTAILSSAPYIEEHKIPRITTGMPLQKVANAGDYHFSFLPEMKHQMKAIANYAKKQGFSTLAVISVNDELGRESISELKQALSSQNITISGEEYFDKAETDFKTDLLKAVEKKPDALYVMGYTGNIIAVVKQSREMRMVLPLLTWNLFQDPDVLKNLGKLAESVVYAYPEDPRPLPVKESFKKRYQEAYGEEPSLYASNAYDSYKLLGKAIQSCGKDRECIKKELYSIKDYEGANGFLTVDERGMGQRSEVSLKTVRNGEFVAIE